MLQAYLKPLDFHIGHMGLADRDAGIMDVADGPPSRFTLSHEDFGVPIALDLVAPKLRLQQQRVTRIVGQWAGNNEVSRLASWEIPKRLHHLIGHRASFAVLKFS